MEDIEYVTYFGQEIYVKPKPLVQKHADSKEKSAPGGGAVGSQVNSQQIDSQKSQDLSGDEEKKKTTEDGKKPKETMSLDSKLTSSLVETSEDEEAKRKEAERKKKEKRGLTAAELDEIIDIELRETSTLILLNIPQTMVIQEKIEDDNAVAELNKKYEELR